MLNGNPYEQDDPNIDAEDYDCTDENPCECCGVCLGEDEWDDELEIDDSFPMELEYDDWKYDHLDTGDDYY